MSGVEIPFSAAREAFQGLLRQTLERAQPIDGDNVEEIELALMEVEIALVRRALRDAGPPAYRPEPATFARQVGTTCMSTSLGNGLLTLGEKTLAADPEDRIAALADDVVSNTSAMGKPGEYRSVDDVFKYLESGRLKSLRWKGDSLEGDYRVRLTNSLADVALALWTGRGRLLVQRSAHARLIFALEEGKHGDVVACLRDPMRSPGPSYEKISLETLRFDYLWSPLKKIPRLFGPGLFSSLSAEELLGHLDRYETMDNLGVDCPSALLYRAADAPPLKAPPPEEPSESA